MDFALTEEQRIIQSAARDFAQKEIAPIAARFDASGEFPMDTIMKAGELGFMGVEVPEEYGGAALDPVGFALVLQEISAADAAHATILSVINSLFCGGLVRYGTEQQKQRYVTPVASGQVVAAYSLTEPQSGSDAANMRVRAERSADGTSYRINGKKSWVTSGPVAKYILMFVQTDPAAGSKGVSAFVIDTDEPGLTRGRSEPKLGIRASATCEIELNDYQCPVEARLGEEGQGFSIAMSLLDSGRIGIAAQAVGIARAAYEATLDFVRERQAFGRPIGSFQMTQAKIADMRMRLDAAQLLVLRAAWAKARAGEHDGRYTLESSMAKLYASEAAMATTHQAVQIHGGMGYSKEMPVERYFRDAKITEIYEGTSEIQRLVIARLETGLR